jgi:hypothetical protein
MSRKEIVDKYLNKFISRKLLVFVVATFGLFLGSLVSDDWVIIATAYIGAQATTDIIKDIYKSRTGVSEEQ